MPEWLKLRSLGPRAPRSCSGSSGGECWKRMFWKRTNASCMTDLLPGRRCSGVKASAAIGKPFASVDTASLAEALSKPSSASSGPMDVASSRQMAYCRLTWASRRELLAGFCCTSWRRPARKPHANAAARSATLLPVAAARVVIPPISMCMVCSFRVRLGARAAGEITRTLKVLIHPFSIALRSRVSSNHNLTINSVTNFALNKSQKSPFMLSCVTILKTADNATNTRHTSISRRIEHIHGCWRHLLVYSPPLQAHFLDFHPPPSTQLYLRAHTPAPQDTRPRALERTTIAKTQLLG